MKQQKETKEASEAINELGQSAPAERKDGLKPGKIKNQPKEYGGRKDGLDPTRFGDWEKNGRCIDF